MRLELIGDWRALDADIVADLEATRIRLADNEGLRLVLALNYGAQDEMLRAVRAIARDAKAGLLDPELVDAAAFETRLDTGICHRSTS